MVGAWELIRLWVGGIRLLGVALGGEACGFVEILFVFSPHFLIIL